MTAQRILRAHLQPEAAAAFWDDIDLDLTEAHLHRFKLSACQVRRAQFDGAEFAETAWFNAATFTGDAEFFRATFTGYAGFGGATFTRDVEFGGATFTRDVEFFRATFTGKTGFGGATFTRDVEFGGARVAPSSRRVSLPAEWITRAAQPAEGEEEGWLYVVRDEDSNEQPAEAPGDGPA